MKSLFCFFFFMGNLAHAGDLELYNAMPSYEFLSQVMIPTFPKDEVPYLAQIKGGVLPKATWKDSRIDIEGVKHPLLVDNLSQGLFRMNGRVLKFDGSWSVEKLIQEISRAVDPKTASRADLFIPQARAAIWVPVAAAIYAVGAIATFESCFMVMKIMDTQRDHNLESAALCTSVGLLWPLGAALAIVAGELPKKTECSGSRVKITTKDGKILDVNEMKTSAAVSTLKLACQKTPKAFEKMNKALEAQSATTRAPGTR